VVPQYSLSFDQGQRRKPRSRRVTVTKATAQESVIGFVDECDNCLLNFDLRVVGSPHIRHSKHNVFEAVKHFLGGASEHRATAWYDNKVSPRCIAIIRTGSIVAFEDFW
jgi:hypothetical protein